MGDFIGQSQATKNVLEVIKAAWESGASVPYLVGPPGIGKTAMVRALGKQLDLPVYILLGSTMDPTDVAGLPALKQVDLPDGSSVTITENTLNYWSEELIRTGKGILFFDELTTTTPAVQAALLSLLQGRQVGRHRIPDSVYFIAAANPADQAADGFELAPPMANRLLHIDFEPDDNDYLQGMSVAWNDKVSDKEMEERSRIVAFLKAYPSNMNAMPKEAAEQGGAWPSYRSWDNLARVLSRLEGRSARSLAIRGLVGEAAQTQFTLFEESLKLPKYEDVLANPEGISWKTLGASESFVTLNMVLARMDEQNFEASAKVFQVAVDQGGREDVGASLAFPLMARLRKCAPSQAEYTRVLGTVLRKFGRFLKDAKIQ